MPDAPPTWDETDPIPQFEDTLPIVKLSPYDQTAIGPFGEHVKPPSGMESGTGFTTALVTGIAAPSASGELVRKGISEVANIPTYVANVSRGRMPGMPGYVEPKTPEDIQQFGEVLQKPLVAIPKLDTSPEVDGFTRPWYEQTAREVVNFALAIPEFFETPLGAIAATAGGTGKFGATAVRRLFLADMTKNLVQQYPEMLRDWGNMSQSEKIKAVVNLGGTAALVGGLASPEIPKVTRMQPPVEFEFAPPAPRGPGTPAFVIPPVLPPPTTGPAPMTAPLPVSPDRPIEGYQLPMLRGAEPGKIPATVPPERARFEGVQEIPKAVEAAPEAAPPAAPTGEAPKLTDVDELKRTANKWLRVHGDDAVVDGLRQSIMFKRLREHGLSIRSANDVLSRKKSVAEAVDEALSGFEKELGESPAAIAGGHDEALKAAKAQATQRITDILAGKNPDTGEFEIPKASPVVEQGAPPAAPAAGKKEAVPPAAEGTAEPATVKGKAGEAERQGVAAKATSDVEIARSIREKEGKVGLLLLQRRNRWGYARAEKALQDLEAEDKATTKPSRKLLPAEQEFLDSHGITIQQALDTGLILKNKRFTKDGREVDSGYSPASADSWEFTNALEAANKEKELRSKAKVDPDRELREQVWSKMTDEEKRKVRQNPRVFEKPEGALDWEFLRPYAERQGIETPKPTTPTPPPAAETKGEEWSPPADFPLSYREPERITDVDAEIERRKTALDSADRASEPFWEKRKQAEDKLAKARRTYDDAKIAAAQRAYDRANKAWNKSSEDKSKASGLVDDAKDAKWWPDATPFQKWIWRMQQEYLGLPRDSEGRSGPEAIKLADRTKAVIEQEWEKAVERQGFTPKEAKDMVRERFTLSSSVWSDPLNPRNEINKLAEWTVRTSKENKLRSVAKDKIEELKIPVMERPTINDYDSVEEANRKVDKAKAIRERLDKEEIESQKRKAEADETEKARLLSLQAEGKLVWRMTGEKKWSGVEGRPVKIPEAAAANFHAYRGGEGWVVIEESTGQSVGTGSTRAAAVDDAKAKITKFGAQKFYQVVQKAQKGLPPKPSLEPTPAAPAPGTKTEMAGPGSPSVTQPMDPTGSQLEQLSQQIRLQSISPKEPFANRLRGALDLAGKWGRGKDAVTAGLGRLTATSQALWNAYRNLPPWTDFTATLGRWIGADQRTAIQVREFQKTLLKAVPNKLRREAITNWIQAEGDEGVLGSRMTASKAAVRRGYEVAMQLNPAEKTLARNISSYFESRLQEGIDAGILKQGVDAYVTQIWKRPTEATRKLWADLFGVGTLNPNFRYAKKRIFESYFEGEQAGYIPRNKDIAHLISVYDMAFNRALSARAMIRELQNGKAKDGKPIVMTSGAGVPLPKEEAPTEAVLVKPNFSPKGAVSEDGRPYRPIDHWALRDWKWAASSEQRPLTESEVNDRASEIADAGGDEKAIAEIEKRYRDLTKGPTVFVQGDMLVHPDHWSHLNNALKSSSLRQHPVGSFALKAGALAKQTKLSLSPFHTVQEGVHALAHRVNPIRPDPINLAIPEQKSLIDHGLMIADPRGYELFTEGMGGGGLVGKVPGLGQLQQWYTEMTFRDYIPRLKMAMAVDALERNRRAYSRQIREGKVSDDQIVALTARESNAAFGEQNYKMMGHRSETVQDWLRLALLAPDFLEARFRFVGQALKPYGREQRIALALMGATLYTGARLLNKWLDDDYHWDYKHAFSVFSGGREYRLRTILGDVQHLVNDPQSFWANRLSPVTRTVMEAISKRDDRGIKRNSVEQFQDFLAWFKPIPFQRRTGDTYLTSALASSGVSGKAYSKQQELYEILDKWRSKQSDPKIREAYDRQRQETHITSPYGPLRLALGANNLRDARLEYRKLLVSRTPEQIRRAITSSRPITGSREAETQFLDSLTPEQQKIYDAAQRERERMEDRLDLIE